MTYWRLKTRTIRYTTKKEKKGSWGKKQTKRDEVTKVTNIGSQITTNSDLTLISGGDQRYQAAKLNSGNDLILQSGGSITFEAVKDLSQESHEKEQYEPGLELDEG